MYCSISRIKTAGTNYLLYETFNILAYPLPIYNNHFSLANHSKYGTLAMKLWVITKKCEKKKGNTNIKQIVFPFGRAETEGFEPSCPGGLTHFECAPL